MLIKIKEWFKKVIDFVKAFKGKIVIGLAVIGGLYLLLNPLYFLIAIIVIITLAFFLFKKT